jgi:KDO2-lipid IV(A) lauroyltransferase
MSALGDHAEVLALRTLGMLCRTAGRRGRVRLGTRLGVMMKGLDARRRNITAENIANAFPELDEPARTRILNDAYANLGIVLAELLAVPSMNADDVKQYVAMPGIEQWRERARRGQSSVLLSGHLGNWELLAMAGALHAETRLTIVAHPQHNAQADRLLNAYRSRFGNIMVPMNQAARPLVSAMTTGGTVAFLADQYADPQTNPAIEFFGRATPTYEAPAALALRYRVPMFAAFAVRQEDGTYIAPFSEIPSDDLDASPEGIAELTRRHVQALERAVREHPGHWSWQHRRWRS